MEPEVINEEYIDQRREKRGKDELPHHFLARLLREIGYERMADEAMKGRYHDYLSDLAFPELQLLQDLEAAMALEREKHIGKHLCLRAIRERHLNGEFDATAEESDAWAESDDGREAFAALGVTLLKGDNDD